jgi:hypothetical protein
MPSSEIQRANFTISPAAKIGIGKIRAEYDAAMPDNPAAVASIAWGYVHPERGTSSERVMVGFYQRSQLPDVAYGIQTVSGVDLIFFVTDETRLKFEGKLLDYEPAQGFFLR